MPNTKTQWKLSLFMVELVGLEYNEGREIGEDEAIEVLGDWIMKVL